MLTSPYFLCLAVSLQIYHANFSNAFTLPLQRSSALSTSMTALNMRSEDNFFDIEAAREQLESMVTSEGDLTTEQSNQQNVIDEPVMSPVSLFTSSESASSPLPATPTLDVQIPRRPPLTSIERERRSTEIQFLGHLSEGNEGMTELRNLWISERGSRAATVLKKANELMEEGPEEQKEAEFLLRALIEEYGVYFTEPVNRLATLYYLHGRLEESLTLHKIVLSIKPWHVDALSHIVMVYAAMGDSERARQWAAFRLPTLSNGANRRRTRWVERAVVDATILLHKGEKINTISFGESDKTWIGKQRSTFDLQNPDDAWQ